MFFKQMLIHPVLESRQIPVQDVPIGLPKHIQSLCPECKDLISAVILEKDGKVMMEKKCKKHGFFEDIISTDVELYLKSEKWTFEDCNGIENPKIKNAVNCPKQCGLCNMHKSFACLTNIDLTNRCNLKCPICFANANARGHVYELSLEQIKNILINIKEVSKPQAIHPLQYNGGEPTIHPHFLEAVKMAKDLGFNHVQIATNGITTANSLDFTKKYKEAGVDVLYLQFDGLDDKVYKKTRGVPLHNLKMEVIENCRKVGMSVCLVQTIVKGVNDDQIGKILEFAIANADVVTGISYQPVAFTGRISREERLRKRYTLADLAHDVEKQTGYATAKTDWYPPAFSSPLTKLLSHIWQRKGVNFTCHSNCGIGTYLIVNIKDKSIKPVSLGHFIDAENMMVELHKLANEQKETIFSKYTKYLTIMKMYMLIKKHFIREKAPAGLTAKEFIKALIGECSKKDLGDWRLMFVAGMHFQDLYNYNIDRIKRCIIHYAAPNGMIYPFCAYNSGMTFREHIEKKYRVS